MNNDSGKWLESGEYRKFNLDQLDGFVTLGAVQESSGLNEWEEEEKMDLLRAPSVDYLQGQNTFKIDRLFRDEELYLGNTSEAGLDSQTLPMLFGNSWHQKKRSDSMKDSEESAEKKEEQILNAILSNPSHIPNLSILLCENSGLHPDAILILPAYSPLSPFLASPEGYPAQCTYKDLLTEVLRYTFHHVHDAVVNSSTVVAIPSNLNTEEVREEPEPQSMIISDIDSFTISGKKKHKQWREEEEGELNRLIDSVESLKEIPEEKWNEMSRRLGRTVCSIHAKLANLKKAKREGTGKRKVISEDSKMDAVTYVDMITNALNRMPVKRGTKEEIVEKVASLYNLKSAEIEKGVAQCLAKKFERCPGFYKLREEVKLPTKEKTRMSVKERLIYILGHASPNREANLTQIRQLYQTVFRDDLDMKITAGSTQAVWEKTISKTLVKFPEFDKTHAKTQYTFKKPVLY